MLFWFSVLVGGLLLLLIVYVVVGIFKLKHKGEEVMGDRKFKQELKDLGMSKEDINITMEDLKQLRKETEAEWKERQLKKE